MSLLIMNWPRGVGGIIERLVGGGLSPQERARLANGLDPFPPVSTPLVLVLRSPRACAGALKELVFHYADINLFGLDGANPLFEVLSQWIAGREGAVGLLELVLRLGANPSLFSVARGCTAVDLVLRHYACRPDAEKMLFLLLAYGGCYSVPDHPAIALRADALAPAVLGEHPVLVDLVRRLWNLPKRLNAVEILDRHRFLGHGLVRPLVPGVINSLGQRNAIRVNPLFEDRGYDGEDGFVFEERFHFSVDMIPHVVASGKNPLTGTPLPDGLRRDWLDRLLGDDPPFPTRSASDVVARWPALWVGEHRSSPDRLGAVCSLLHSWISLVHPYTQIMGVPGWSEQKQGYLLDLMETDDPTITDALTGVVSAAPGDGSVLTRLHFLIEGAAEDYALYEELMTMFGATGFVFYFLDAIVVPGVLDVLLRRTQRRSFFELYQVWFRVCDVYFHEHALGENTTPALLTR
jgi:hypothetical protein